MDSVSWGFLLTVIIDLIVMIGLLCIFCAFKKYRCNPNPTEQYNVFLSESSLSFHKLALTIYQTNLQDIKQSCNEESHHYLYLNKILAWFITIQSIYSTIILLPVYSSGNNDTENMYYLSFGNIMNDGVLLIAPFVIFLVNIGFSYYILKLYVQETKKSLMSSTTNRYAIRILRLPENMPQSELARKVAEQLEIDKEKVYVVPNLKKAIEYNNRLPEAQSELLHYLDLEKTSGKRPMVKEKVLFGKNIDAIDHWEKKVKRLKDKLERVFLNAKTTNSGVCIIRTSEPASAKEITSCIRKKFLGVIVTSVVNPDDVKWENIDVDDNSARGSRLCLTLVFFLIFVVFLTPTTFLYYMNDILSGIGINSAFLGFLGLYVPDLLLLLYQLVLVPYTVIFLVNRERHFSKSKEVISAMRKFLLFFMFNILFVPAIGMQAYKIIDMALNSESFNTWSKAMVVRVNSTSIWFMAYIVTQTFIVSAKELIQPGRVIEVRYRSFRAISERETYNAYLPEPVNYAYDYAVLLTFITAILIYSISYPLILIFGSMYLWVRYYVHKYNIMCLFSKESVPSTVSNIAVKTFAVSILLFQWVTCFLFILSNFQAYLVLGFIILTAGGIIFVVFWVQYRKIFELILGVQSQHLIDTPYMHPLDPLRNS